MQFGVDVILELIWTNTKLNNVNQVKPLQTKVKEEAKEAKRLLPCSATML